MQAVSKAMMQKSVKVVVVSQHYPPDPSTTAAIMAAIAERVAQEIQRVHPLLAKYMPLPEETWQGVEEQHFAKMA